MVKPLFNLHGITINVIKILYFYLYPYIEDPYYFSRMNLFISFPSTIHVQLMYSAASIEEANY